VKPYILESSSEQFLTKLKSAWDDHRLAMRMILDCLMYMDIAYVRYQRLEPIYNVGLILFRDNIVRYPIVRERLQNTLLKMVDHGGCDGIVDKTVLKGIYQMLISLGMDSRSVYEEDFEKPFLKQLAEFYQLQSQKLLAENSISEYIHKVSTLIDEVAQWTGNCFDELTKERINEVLENELITKHIKSIMSMINSSIVYMLTSNKYDELEIIYKHFDRFLDVYSTISNCVSDYLHKQGRVLDGRNEEHNSNDSVQNFLDLKDTLNNFLNISTKYDKALLERIKRDFEYIINLNEYTVKCLSSVIDDQLNKGIKNLNDEQIIGLFKRMILLYYSKEKDVFNNYYQNIKQQLLNLILNTDERNETNASIQLIDNVVYVKDIFDIFIKIASNEDKVSFFLNP
jgi:cullin 3